MEQDRTRKRALSAALVAIAAAGAAFAGPAVAGEKKDDQQASPPAHAPAHGARGETPPPHAPAHGVRDTQPAPEPAAPKKKAKQPAPPAHAPARGRRGTAPAPKTKKAKAPKAAPKPSAKSEKPKAAKPESAKENSAGGRPKETLCHATGSAKNPYVTITIADRGVQNGHSGHEGDIIPAPAGGCPTPTEEAARTAPGDVAAVMPAGSADSRGGEDRRVETGGGVITSAQMGTMPAKDEGRIAVLGVTETEEGAATPEAAPLAAVQTADGAEDGGLPFTGANLALIVIAGLVVLLTGIAIRRATVARQPR
ncbi:MAG TPA: hypothetical protein VGW10_18185 [Solirubrobacteraceae bacterium]|nr:hypothetical protein [Solirubrobacteraceae bacterium]